METVDQIENGAGNRKNSQAKKRGVQLSKVRIRRFFVDFLFSRNAGISANYRCSKHMVFFIV